MPSSPMPSAIGSSTQNSRSTLPAKAIGVSKPENLLPEKKTRNDRDLRLRRCPMQGGTELRKSPGPQAGNSAGSGRHRQLALFPAERAVPDHAKGFGVQVRLDAMELHRPRQWGACWLACHVYEQLQLDRFF